MSGMASPSSLRDALPIPALVVMANARTDELDVRHVTDDRVAQRNVLLEHGRTVGGQLEGLRRMVSGSDLADVVRSPAR